MSKVRPGHWLNSVDMSGWRIVKIGKRTLPAKPIDKEAAK